ncbi:pseudouridine synthase [Niameybacter massiliensis]|uniref:pseudouridine synthase n=1 Tax=Niameybacter massiliensis TaxID=1658108 RepID=UPI0006B5478E|nr:pseudouridine synthase [Niameybacter massiliensis]
MRINKLLSNKGICSRKQAHALIEAKRVLVNNQLCIPGQWVEEEDEIRIDHELIVARDKVYILLNKPVGITCTADPDVKDNIISFVNYPEYIFPVGRLDKDSQGLILLTNDGDLANEILDSENIHEKEYIVKVDRAFDEAFVKGMSEGVMLKGVKTRPCKVRAITEDTFSIIMTQGLNRQIRKMSKAFGYTVVRLERVRILHIGIEDLAYGSWRMLTKMELEELKMLSSSR